MEIGLGNFNQNNVEQIPTEVEEFVEKIEQLHQSDNGNILYVGKINGFHVFVDKNIVDLKYENDVFIPETIDDRRKLFFSMDFS